MSARSLLNKPAPRLLVHFAVGLTLVSAYSILAPAQPKIAIRDTLIAMGELYHNTKVTRTTIVRNTGSANLHVTSVNSSCGCTVAEISKNDIAPGDSAELSIKVNTAILIGNVRKNIVVATNDPKTPARIVYYEADVINVLTSVPAYLYLGEGIVHANLSAELRLTNTTKKPIHIFGLSSASGKLRFSQLPGLLAPGDSTRLTVTVTPEAVGTIKDELRIETDHEVQKTVRIGVTGRVRPQK